MLNQNSSLSEITQSIRHINEVFLPSIKQKLASKTHFGAENTFDALINNIALDKVGGRKWASGSKTVEIVRENFDLRPAGIIKMLDLRRPIYKQTAAYGHFGRNDLDLPWEKTDKVDILKAYF